MPTLQHLSNQQIDDVLEIANQRHVPVTVTVRGDLGWRNLRSQLLDIRDGRLFLEMPTDDAGDEAHAFSPADKAGVSFKLKHHKHIFTGTVACAGTATVGEGTRRPVLQVCSPTRMHRLQRRAFHRVDVPAHRIVRASFWYGGCEAEPSGSSPDRPIWSGRVTNLSAGGVQIECDQGVEAWLDVGETVGMHIRFGADHDVAYADAQFRHSQACGNGLLLGFQFVALGQTDQGRKALRLITTRTAQYQREASSSERDRALERVS